MKKYDVCAVGNALVDYEIEVTDPFFQENEVEKGLMTLVDEERQAVLLEKAQGKIKKRQGGGSAANTVFGLAAFGGNGYYTCKVADDADGGLYTEDLSKAGINSNTTTTPLPLGTTGKCLVMITPDAERTMNTFLGITSDLSEDEIDEDAIKQSSYVFLEGFLVSSEKGFRAMKKAKALAQKHDVKVALTFSDPSMVKYFSDQMKEIVGDGVDLLFCNLEEAELFTGRNDLSEIKAVLEPLATEFVLTKGKNGAMVYDGTQYHDIAPFPTQAVDATGAGDMFAGAFLYGITHGKSHAEAGRLASAASSAVVSKYGPRLNENQVKEVLAKV